MFNAQQARSVLDLLIGYNISPLLFKAIQPKLSAGRCQSPALRLVCEREKYTHTLINAYTHTYPYPYPYVSYLKFLLLLLSLLILGLFLLLLLFLVLFRNKIKNPINAREMKMQAVISSCRLSSALGTQHPVLPATPLLCDSHLKESTPPKQGSGLRSAAPTCH